MKTFSAYEFIRNPAPVYDAACKDGSVKINHGQYKSTIFVLSAKERGSELRDKSTTDPRPE